MERRAPRTRPVRGTWPSSSSISSFGKAKWALWARTIRPFKRKEENGKVESTARERLIGIWELVSIRETLPDGTERDRPDFGPAPAGLLVYTRTGHVSVHFMRRARSSWREEEAPSAEERA